MSIIRKNDTIYMSDAIGMTRCKVPAATVNYSEHYHDFVELVYMLKGKSVHTVDGVEYAMKRGDMILVNYGQSHTISGDSDVEYINVYIKPEYINCALSDSENAFALLNLREFSEFKESVDTERCRVSFVGAERDRIEGLLFLLEEDITYSLPGSSLALHSELNLLLICFFRKTSVFFGDSFDGITDGLLAYIKSNIHQKLTLTTITEKCSYNKSYFSRVFKKYTGMTFTEYLKKERIEKAKELLLTTSSNTEQIYVAVGYSDKTKFYKDFKKLVGTTPTEFRKSKK